ncbi:MAG: hypothetical protein AAB382_05820, partial [Chloroflexota bacterium]
MTHLLTVAVGGHYLIDRVALSALVSSLPGLQGVALDSIPPPRVLVWDAGAGDTAGLPRLPPETALLLLVAVDDYSNLPSGVAGFFSKDETPEALGIAIRQVARGEQYLSNQVVLPAIHAPLGASFQHRLCVTLQAMNTSSSSRTRLAILGTLSDLHRQPIAYDLNCLRSLVADLAPDLLCAEITREAWEGGDFSSATVEVREALAPVGAATDIVIVPVASTPRQYIDFAPSEQWRRDLVLAFDRLLQWGQRQANRPEAVNGLL